MTNDAAKTFLSPTSNCSSRQVGLQPVMRKPQSLLIGMIDHVDYSCFTINILLQNGLLQEETIKLSTGLTLFPLSVHGTGSRSLEIGVYIWNRRHRMLCF